MDYNKKPRQMFTEEQMAKMVEATAKYTERKCRLKIRYFVSVALASTGFVYLFYEMLMTIQRWADMNYPIYRHNYVLEYGAFGMILVFGWYAQHLDKKYNTELNVHTSSYDDCDI
ncbi:MAG: hypothetical protein J6W64_08860 [Bacilli bacterium]|nr:hypothetical protein [Bacilli bacterium]